MAFELRKPRANGRWRSGDSAYAIGNAREQRSGLAPFW